MSHVVIVVDTENDLHRGVTAEALETYFMAGRELHFGHVNGEPVVLNIENSRVTVVDEADEVELFRGEKEFYWHRLSAGNHKIISHGESHPNADDCSRSAVRANPDLSSESFVMDNGPEDL